MKNEEKEEISTPKGGVIFEKSRCCGADVKYTSGGVMIKICSKCGKEVKPLIFK